MECILEIIKRLFFKAELIYVYRMPSVGVLRANSLGLTTALFFVILMLGIGYSTEQLMVTPYQVIILFFIFLVGTYIGLAFLILIAILILIQSIIQFEFLESRLYLTFLYLGKAYIVGYIFGAILAQLYNFFVFFYLHCFKQDEIHISFSYLRNQSVNVIKSPKTEANTIPAARTLYDYHIADPPDHPYTIVFIANPKILPKMEFDADDPNLEGLTEDQIIEERETQLSNYRLNADNYEPDPIISDLDLFIKNVDRALYCFERDEVLGRPEIWSRIRVITIFDPEIITFAGTDSGRQVLGLLEGYQNEVTIDELSVNNLITSIDEIDDQSLDDILSNRWNTYIEDEELGLDINFNDIDVFFILSASHDYTRSTAKFSSISDADIMTLPGDDYTVEGDPVIGSGGLLDSRRHEERASSPGKVALNVLTARQKTFIHEFAHAMSLAECSAIVDEYFDQMSIDEHYSIAPRSINRLERGNSTINLSRIPKLFTRYNNADYHSDMDHPSAEENWYGFFPERAAKDIGCIMDRTIGRYQFNKLLVNFMYDRIITKNNRT